MAPSPLPFFIFLYFSSFSHPHHPPFIKRICLAIYFGWPQTTFVVQAGLELSIFLHQPVTCWGYRFVPPHLTSACLHWGAEGNVLLLKLSLEDGKITSGYLNAVSLEAWGHRPLLMLLCGMGHSGRIRKGDEGGKAASNSMRVEQGVSGSN